MVKINKKFSVRNRTVMSNKRNLYIVIHYVGAVSTASANASYFYSTYRGASAHYFVDDTSIWQAVADKNAAWHCGGGLQGSGKHPFYGKCKNSNSIGIEMCCKKKNGKLYITDKTIENTADLVKHLMKKHGISADHVIRHYDVTSKNCLPLDSTELLTESGWISLNDVTVGDEIAAYNTHTNKISFEPIKDIVAPYDSKVVKNRGIEATENHRMWAVPNAPNSHKYREVLWGDILSGYKSYLVKNGALYDSHGIDLSDDELRFLVWVQGDGHYMKNKKGDISGLEFHLKKERKIIAVADLLDSLEFQYTICNKSDGTVSFRCYSRDLVDWCETWLDTKQFSWKFLKMNNSQFSIFWNELLIVDGCIAANSYCSTKEINLDIVQAICATKGIRAHKCNTGNSRAVIRSDSNYSVGNNCHRNDITYRTTSVSCVTVDSSYILIRQNGKTFIVGNCPAPYVNDSKWKTLHKKLTGTSTAPEPAYPTVTLQKGDTGSQVKKLQKCLNKIMNAGLTVDGSFGPATLKAVKAFQKKYKLEVDGSVGPKTRAKIKELM